MSSDDYLKSLLVPCPDFPKKGVVFLDMSSILSNPLAFETLVSNLSHHLTAYTIHKSPKKKIDAVVGLDSRGFIFGPILALRLGAAFVMVRKKGKLPGRCVEASFEKEYGSDTFEMQSDIILPGHNVIVIDDLIATGGSAQAAGELVRQQGGTVLEYVFPFELTFLSGAAKLDAPVYSVVKIDS